MSAVRVLHVVGQMSRGGIETWLMHVLREMDGARVRMDFLVLRPEPGDYDAEIGRLGSSVIRCASPRSPLRFVRCFSAALRERGPYHVVHSHVHHFSGLVLALARRAGVPVRIAHCHMDSSELDAKAGAIRRAYLRLMKAAVRVNATHGFAVSGGAARALFGRRWREDDRWEVARCGLDFSAFRGPAELAAVRADLGVPAGALVLGHVGRFDGGKNQSFAVRILEAAAGLDARAFLVLVGEGRLRPTVETLAARLGVRERVAFAGLRADVPRLLRSFDVFLLPSVHEGLPLVGLEAQAAGLPIVLSDHLTRELVVVPELFTWVPLSLPAEAWAEAALSAARRSHPAPDSVSALERSEFSLRRSVSELLAAYGATA